MGEKDVNEPFMQAALLPNGEGPLIGDDYECEVPSARLPNGPTPKMELSSKDTYKATGVDCVIDGFLDAGIMHYTDKFFSEKTRTSAVTRGDFVFALPIGRRDPSDPVNGAYVYKDAFDRTAEQTRRRQMYRTPTMNISKICWPKRCAFFYFYRK